MANNPIHLTILRRGDIHIVDLAEVQAIIPRSETRVDGAFLEEISQEIKRITNIVGPEFRRAAVSLEPEVGRTPSVVKELKNLGSLVFSHLLTEAARERLRSSESCNLYLRLDDQIVHIPWELAFDGQQFLGMKFRVGRQIITHHRISQGVSQVAPARVASDTLRVLIVSDPSETLKNVSRESEQLCEILEGISGLQVRLLGGRGVKRIPLLAALRESDIVHFAGHSQFDEKNPENSGWLLYDGLLSASEISKLDQAPLLVFSNSCQAGATKNWEADYLFEGQAFGLGSAFLLAGVKNYVGTFCVVHDEESRFLAVEFYRRIAQGESIGHALLEARLATADEMGLDRLTWASYMLYGDPGFSPMGSEPSAVAPSFMHPRKTIDVVTEKSEVSEQPAKYIQRHKLRPAVSHRLLAWLSGILFGIGLTVFFLAMWMRPTIVIEPPDEPLVRGDGEKHGLGLEIAKRGDQESEAVASRISPPATQLASEEPAPAAVTRPSTKTETGSRLSSRPLPTKPKPSQNLGDIKVEIDHLQVTSRKEVIVFLKIFNKTPKNLAIVLGGSKPFVTDNKGFSYRHRISSGIKSGQRYQGNWTYIPPSGEHTISMRFRQSGSRPQKDSIYSISVEAVLASPDDLERTPRGRRPDGARTVNISIHGIQAD